MKTFHLSYLAIALLGLVSSSVALAQSQNDDTLPTLDTIQIQVEKQGAKISTNVVTEKAKDVSTATDLRGLLKAEPSIDFTGGNGASQFWTIRGMGQNSIDVKVDNAYSDSQILYHQGRFTLDPALVKIVSVQKGAGSASAGIGATNGAIIAKTVDALDLLKNSDKNWGTKIHAGYSSNNEHSYGATSYAKSDKFDFLIATNRVEQDDYKAGKGYVSINKDSTVPFSASDKVSNLYKIGYNLNDYHRFVISHFTDINKGTRSVREEFDVRPASEVSGRLTMDRQKPTYRELSLSNTNLEWAGKSLGFIDEATANFYVMKNTRASTDDTGSYGGVTGFNKTSVTTKGANLNFDSKLTNNTLLKYGVNYRHQEIEPNRKSPAFVKNTEKTDTGVYAEAIYDIGQFTLTGGLRYDHFKYTAVNGRTASNGRVSPSLGVIYQATPSLSFNLTHNHATRSPRLADALLSGGRDISIADGVKAERAKNNEIGFNYDDGNFFANGGFFYQKINGLLNSGRVVHDASGLTHDTAIDNVGYAKNKGWELNAGYKQQNLTVRLGIADSKPEFYTYPGKLTARGQPIEFTNREFGGRIGRTWTAGIAYYFAQPNLEVGLNHRLTQDVKGANAWMSNPNSAQLNLEREGYHVTDIYGNWKPLNNDRLNVNFAVNNISDKGYRPHSSQGLPAAGRDYRIGFNYTF